MLRYSCNSHSALFFVQFYCMQASRLTWNSSVPTVDQILVPETLLKKRKSQEKAREERAADLQKRKKVSNHFLLHGIGGVGGLYDA